MIVVDASVFIDLLFEYNSERIHHSEELFTLLEGKGLTILGPDLFKVELTGQIGLNRSHRTHHPTIRKTSLILFLPPHLWLKSRGSSIFSRAVRVGMRWNC